MIKWIGQHIVDFIARFRSDVYLEDIADGTVADNKFLGLDSNNKVVKEAASATVTDLHSAGVDGSANQLLTDNGDGTVNSEANSSYNGSALTLLSSTSSDPSITLANSNTDAVASRFMFKKTATGANSDNIGNIDFLADNDADEVTAFARIEGGIASAVDTDEAGHLNVYVATSNGISSIINRTGLSLLGSATGFTINATIGYGTASLTTIAGTLTMGTTAAMTNAGQLSVAAQPNITTMTGFLGGTANALVTDDGDGTVTSEAGLTYDSEVLTIGDDDNGNATITRKAHSDDNGGPLTLSGGDGTGTDKNGGTIVISGGVGTGTGGGGGVRLATAAAGAGSGSSANPLAYTWDFLNSGKFQTSTVGLGIVEYANFNIATFENVLSDGDHVAGKKLVYSPGANDTLADGQIFFLHTDGTWDQADASATSTGASQLLCVGNGLARSTGVILDGFVRIPSTEILNTPGSGAVDGLPLYVSTTAGHFDFTAPSGNNEFVRVVGYAIDDDSSDVLVYFNPDSTYVKITA